MVGKHSLECLSVEVWPVSKCAGHHESMYVVERVAKVPRFFQVVNLELYVRRLVRQVNDRNP